MRGPDACIEALHLAGYPRVPVMEQRKPEDLQAPLPGPEGDRVGDEKDMKITHDRTIEIRATPEQVYEYIETMPDKFPTFRLFDTKPLLFLRIAMVDGMKSALKVIRDDSHWQVRTMKEAEPLTIGSTFGPFTIIEAKKPEKYYFSLNSFFFKGVTGYTIVPGVQGAILHFDLRTDTAKAFQIVWIHAVMPVHHILARIVLGNIKAGVESKTRKP